MKRMIALAALVAFSTPALAATEAEKERAKHNLCNSYKTMAVSALSSRAGGVSVNNLLSAVSDEYSVEVTLRAYEYPLPDTEAEQLKAIRSFSQEVYEDCRENYIPSLGLSI